MSAFASFLRVHSFRLACPLCLCQSRQRRSVSIEIGLKSGACTLMTPGTVMSPVTCHMLYTVNTLETLMHNLGLRATTCLFFYTINPFFISTASHLTSSFLRLSVASAPPACTPSISAACSPCVAAFQSPTRAVLLKMAVQSSRSDRQPPRPSSACSLKRSPQVEAVLGEVRPASAGLRSSLSNKQFAEKVK